MTKSNVIQLPPTKEAVTAQRSLWVLFVLEDLRTHFSDECNQGATELLEQVIQDLEPYVLG